MARIRCDKIGIASFEEANVDDLHSSVFETMNDYRKQNLFCDVTLDINGTLFPCHRLVLTIMSPYFRTMFNGNFKEGSSKVVPMQDIDAEIMEIILHAIYTARIHLLPKNVYFVLKASHLLQLDSIFNVCVDCIMKNVTFIYYLPETCLFANSIKSKALYAKCVEALAAGFLNWGKTDGFLNLSFDIISEILLNVRSKSRNSDDGILAIIIKWCKHNDVSRKNMKVLLKAPKFNSKSFEISAIPELIVAAKGEDCDKCAENTLPSSDLNLVLYLNAVDVKSGAKGWATLKLNESFDKYTLSNFRASDSPYRKVCSIGTKIYCFEVNAQMGRYSFSCFDESGGIADDLLVPNVYGSSTSIGYYILSGDYVDYELIADAKENKIYLLYGLLDTEIWVYDCELNSWQGDTFKVLVSELRGLQAALYDYKEWFAVSFFDHVFYFVGCQRYYSIGCDERRNILTIDTRTPTVRNLVPFPKFKHLNAAVCEFDGKLAISGSDYDGILRNAFSIYDVKTEELTTDLKPMNEGRAGHKMIHHNGFIYALENSPFNRNEKYDTKLNMWIEIPKLPERVQFVNTEGVDMTIAFTSVLNVESISL
ncbi:kelch-like protein 3 [Planococcus citri]|uniref:kelch-like protein 3 n=1 Tax=Planococcus citri TaxID=170843 RepID=UPI0031F77618